MKPGKIKELNNKPGGSSQQTLYV